MRACPKTGRPPAAQPEQLGRKLWGGRFEAATDPAVERFTASIHFDQALARYDIRLSLAHARMLQHAGLLSADEERAIRQGLEAIARELEAGSFPIDPALEDIHMNVEARLRERIGPAAGRLHTGRSRNDQVATDLALYLRDAGAAAQRGLLELRRVLTARAREHLDTVLPGYTHLQRAQPVRLAHHWLAFVEMLARDGSRFRDLGGRLRLCPLGAGALAGTTLPLDREETARALGFDAPARNSMDAVASRDAALEFLAATRDRDGAPLAPGRGAGAVVDGGVRLRRARRRLRHRLEPDAAEEEPRRARAGARQVRPRDREPGGAADGAEGPAAHLQPRPAGRQGAGLRFGARRCATRSR